MRTFLLTTMLLSLMACGDQKPVRILVVTGGHDFDHPNFIEMFESFENTVFTEVIQPDANHLYASDSLDQIDVLVFYDMVQDISDEQKAAFLDMPEKGKGLVFLHHSIASYQAWDEFLNILGARYHLDVRVSGADTLPASDYQEGLDVDVTIADDQHPITRNLSNFTLHDEVYNGVELLPGLKPLLTTTHPQSMPVLAWAHEYANSRIVYIQPGHDNNAFSDANYRRLVRQAIEWVKNHSKQK